MHPRLRKLLAEAKFVVHPQRFCIVGVPASEQSTVVSLGAWGAAVQTGDRVTYVLPEQDWQRVAAKFPHARVTEGWKLVTLDAQVPWEVYGVLAELATALAERGIPCACLSSFDTDHLLVPEGRLGGALQGLEALREEARG
ncbi:MAG: ACT domain-containing protein [Halobacteriales archaeon]|nr:ACT domain-containing protein [Halobacteriales archaeon]